MWFTNITGRPERDKSCSRSAVMASSVWTCPSNLSSNPAYFSENSIGCGRTGVGTLTSRLLNVRLMLCCSSFPKASYGVQRCLITSLSCNGFEPTDRVLMLETSMTMASDSEKLNAATGSRICDLDSPT